MGSGLNWLFGDQTAGDSAAVHALTSIDSNKYNRDFTQNIQALNAGTDYMAKYLRVMQKGIDDANKNIIQKIQDFIADLIIIFTGGGTGDSGFDWGDLQYIIEALGELFGIPENAIDGAIDLFNAVLHFFENFLSPLTAFGNAVNSFIQTVFAFLASLLSNVPFVGDTLEEIVNNVAAGMNETTTTADTAQTTASSASSSVVTLQNTVFNVKSNRPLYDGVDPTGESTFPYLLLGGGIHSHTASAIGISGTTGGGGAISCSATAHSHPTHTHSFNATPTGSTGSSTATFAVTQSASAGGFVRLVGGTEKKTFSWMGSGNTSITGAYITVYKQEANGDLTKFHESSNLSGDLSSSMSWYQYTIPTATPGYLAEEGDVICIELRIVGSGTHNIAGITMMDVLPLAGFRPTKIGMTRDSGTGSSPSSIADASVGYSNNVPFFSAGSDIGAGSQPLVWSDDFNRSTIGNTWALRSTTSNLTISSNTLAYNGTTDGTQAGIYVYPLNSDKVAVQAQLTGMVVQPTFIVLCSNNVMTKFAALQITQSAVAIVTGTAIDSLTSRASLSITNSDNDGFGIQYSSVTNTFSVYKNSDTTPILTWVDSTNIVSHGKGYRYVGAMIKRSAFVNGSNIDSWLAYDIPS